MTARKPRHPGTRKQGRITDAEKEEMVRLAREGLSQHEIAQRIGCSRTTVEKWVRALAPEHEWDRESTARAVRAHQVDLAARRAQIQAEAMEDYAFVRARLRSPYTYYTTHMDRDGVIHEWPRTADVPEAKEMSLIVGAMRTLRDIDSKIEADRRAAEDRDTGSVSQFDAWLEAMTGAPANPAPEPGEVA